MVYSKPGFPVLHHLLELVQTHVHWVGDAIQPPHPIAPFSSYSQSSPASGYFPVSWLFTSGSQSIGAPASVFLMNTQCWFPLGLTCLISLQPQRLSRLSPTPQFKSINSAFLWSNSHIHTWLEKTIALTIWTFVRKVMSLHFNILSRFVIAFLP